MNRRNRPDPRRAGSVSKHTMPPEPQSVPMLQYECEADVLEGLERFAQAELRERFGRRVQFNGETRPGRLHFRFTGALTELIALQSVLAVYLVVSFAIPRPKALLGNQQMSELIAAINLVRGLSLPGTYTSLRLSAAGEDSAVLSRLKDELAQRLDLMIAPEEGDLLLRLRRSTQAAGWEMLVRLSPRPLSTRRWRVCNRPGAPNATLAHAMMQLSAATANDTVLNMACGSGTLLIELLMLSQVKQAIGCDIDAQAIECARENVRAAGYNRFVRLEQWDAGAVPLPDASVQVICADLPFGQLSGSHRENEVLYPRIMREATRLAQAGARMVLLTHEVRLLERVAAQFTQQWQLQEMLRVRSSGMIPVVALYQRNTDQ